MTTLPEEPEAPLSVSYLVATEICPYSIFGFDCHNLVEITTVVMFSCDGLFAVTTCSSAAEALTNLRVQENFDLVLSDVYMPDMDGFKLLETIGLEMDMPVISMLQSLF